MATPPKLRAYFPVLVFATILLFAGCAQFPGFGEQAQTEPPPATEPVPEPMAEPPPEEPDEQLTASGYVLRAIERLQIGEEYDARLDLKRALELQPGNGMANSLTEQLDADPRQTLGTQYFLYDAQYGDSLSIIAKNFLGDPLKFYILARYNDIDNPSLLAVGQTVKVPGERPDPSQPVEDAEVAETDQPPSAPLPGDAEDEDYSDERDGQLADDSTVVDYPVAKLLYLKGDYNGAIQILENGTGDSESRELLVLTYSAYADELVAANRLPEARSALASASDLAPSNQTITAQLAAIDDRIEANLHFDQGMSEMGAGELTNAYESFNQALVYQPDHAPATEQLATVKERLIAGYLDQAGEMFTEQRLDEAIDLWDKVLELDPDNETASSRRSTALKVKMQVQ